MTAPKRCKGCGRSRKDLKGAKDIPPKHQSSLWESGTSTPGYGNDKQGDMHCYACVGKRSTALWSKLLDNGSHRDV